MYYKKWTRECLRTFMAYDQKTLENLLFKSKISGIPSNNELRASVEEILTVILKWKKEMRVSE